MASVLLFEPSEGYFGATVELMKNSFEEILDTYDWRAIRGCPGRFVLRGGPTSTSPDELLGKSLDVDEHVVSATKDPVHVTRLADGGLISYVKPDGLYIHTLNDKEGFERKMGELGIPIQQTKLDT